MTCKDCVHYDVCEYHITEETDMTINECPHQFKNKADFAEVRHGVWLEKDRSGRSMKGFMVCSFCDVMIPTCEDNRYCLPRLGYCPNCGAKMDGKEASTYENEGSERQG